MTATTATSTDLLAPVLASVTAAYQSAHDTTAHHPQAHRFGIISALAALRHSGFPELYETAVALTGYRTLGDAMEWAGTAAELVTSAAAILGFETATTSPATADQDPTDNAQSSPVPPATATTVSRAGAAGPKALDALDRYLAEMVQDAKVGKSFQDACRRHVGNLVDVTAGRLGTEPAKVLSLEIDREDVRTLLAQYEIAGLSGTTRSTYYGYLLTWATWCAAVYRVPNVVAGVRRPERARKVQSKIDVGAAVSLLQAAMRGPGNRPAGAKTRARDVALVLLTLGTGLRLDEITQLSTTMFVTKRLLIGDTLCEITGLQFLGKDDYERWVPLHPVVLAAWETYRDTERAALVDRYAKLGLTSDALFLTTTLKANRPDGADLLRAGHDTLGKRLDVLCERAGIKVPQARAHFLRRGYATVGNGPGGGFTQQRQMEVMLGHCLTDNHGRYRDVLHDELATCALAHPFVTTVPALAGYTPKEN